MKIIQFAAALALILLGSNGLVAACGAKGLIRRAQLSRCIV
jgi:hypothetical protein